MTSTTGAARTSGAVTGAPGWLRTSVRAALWFMAAVQAVVGVWAQFAPESFYRDFPLGLGWVQLLPPYNEHLTRDVGGLSLSLTAVLLAAAVRTDRWTVRVATVAMFVFTVPHTVFHSLHLEHFPTADAVVQTVGTFGLTGLTVVIWLLAGRLPTSAR